MTKKKITTLRDIERNQGVNPRIIQIGPTRKIEISLETAERIKIILEEEKTKRKKENKIRKIKENIGFVFALLVMLTLALGCIWLIKIFIRGILG